MNLQSIRFARCAGLLGIAVAICVSIGLVPQGTAAAETSRHPRLVLSAPDVARLRQRFEQPAWAVFKHSLLDSADQLMAYEGESPQPGKTLSDSTRAWKLVSQRKQAVLSVLPAAYLFSGQERYRDMLLAVMRHETKRRYDVQQYRWEFELTRHGAPAALAYDWLWPEMTEEDRQAFGQYLDQYLTFKTKPSYGWSNNIGAIYWSGVGLVALARYHENPVALDVVKKCIANLDTFYKASILPHDDSGYPP